MSQRQVCFSHGQESGPWGRKISALAEVARAAGCAVASLDYRGIADVGGRVARLQQHLATLEAPAVLVGSSMGAYVSLQAARARPVAGLFLLAPALYLPGYEDVPEALPGVPVMMVHGWGDTVVPWRGSLRLARKLRARLLLLDGDHRLTAAIDEICGLFRGFLDRSGAVPRA